MPNPIRILLLLVLSAASAGAQRSDVLAYISARADYQRSMDTLWSKSADAAMRLDGAFVDRYRPQLEGIVGTMQFALPVDSSRTQIGSMQGYSENNPLADGIMYRLRDGTSVFATDTTIFHAWATQTRRDEDPADLLKAGSVIGAIFDRDAATYRCGFVPVNWRGRNVVTALMIEYSQDKGPACFMDAIVVAVEADHRLILAVRMLPRGTKPNASLASSIAQALLDRIPDR
jgi:hypothetical protein